jgi:hypothetical protein
VQLYPGAVKTHFEILEAHPVALEPQFENSASRLTIEPWMLIRVQAESPWTCGGSLRGRGMLALE